MVAPTLEIWSLAGQEIPYQAVACQTLPYQAVAGQAAGQAIPVQVAGQAAAAGR